MKFSFFHYLRFTRVERRGTVVLLLLALGLYFFPELWWKNPSQNIEIQDFTNSLNASKPPQTPLPSLQEFSFDPNTASQEDFQRLGLSEKLAATICRYREKGGKFREPADFKKIWGLRPEAYERLLPFIQIGGKSEGVTESAGTPKTAFEFDPNTIGEADLFRLGLPSATVKSILNFRIKGGKFRSAADFGKIYTLRPADYERLQPFIRLSEGSEALPPDKRGPMGKQPALAPIEVNKADVEAWKQLPGIGEGRARQLVNFREKLGGFRSIAQIAEMHGMPDSIFLQIRPYLLWSGEGLRQLDINTASLQELEAHPYISKKQAEVMVGYRLHHGRFQSLDDLEKVIALRDKIWLEKIRPYLKV